MTLLFSDLYAEGVVGDMADLDQSALYMVHELFAPDDQHDV